MATEIADDVELLRVPAGREQLVVRLSSYGSSGRRADVRRFWQNDEGEWLPSKKGTAIPTDALPAVIEALTKAQRMLVP